jgi:hypothetical protein
MRQACITSPTLVGMFLASMAHAATPSFGCGARAIPRAARDKWLTRSRRPAAARASLVSSATRSLTARRYSFLSQAVSFLGARPSAVTLDMGVIMCRCGFRRFECRDQSTTWPIWVNSAAICRAKRF